MTTPIEDTLASKLAHFVIILLVVAYVVFVKKSFSAVESVSTSAKIVHAPTYQKGSTS
jgi:Ca2+/Na+ antiporter